MMPESRLKAPESLYLLKSNCDLGYLRAGLGPPIFIICTGGRLRGYYSAERHY
jgi:hypothetical protein